MAFRGKHLRVLKKASRKVAVYSRDKYGEIIDYLLKDKVIDFTIKRTDKGVFYHVKTNEKGKALLYERGVANRRANIAIVLSIIAIIISVLTAFTPFADWSKAFMQSLFL